MEVSKTTVGNRRRKMILGVKPIAPTESEMIAKKREIRGLHTKTCAHCEGAFVTPFSCKMYCSSNCQKRAFDARGGRKK